MRQDAPVCPRAVAVPDRALQEAWLRDRMATLSFPEADPAGAATQELLSLSRLNHWLPGREAHPEVMQGTAEFHHEITDALLP